MNHKYQCMECLSVFWDDKPGVKDNNGIVRCPHCGDVCT